MLEEMPDKYANLNEVEISKTFQEFILYVTHWIQITLEDKIWSITDLTLINNDFNFTNWVFKYYDCNKKQCVVKTNFWGRSIWTNFTWFLKDKEKLESCMEEEKCPSIIEQQYNDYKLLSDLWIPTIPIEDIQLVGSLLIMPYFTGEDLWSKITKKMCKNIDLVLEKIGTIITSLEKLYEKWKIYWDLKMDNIYFTEDKVILIDPQIKDGEKKADIWKLIFSILLICYNSNNLCWYDKFRRFCNKNLLYSREAFTTMRKAWFEIYKHLLSLEYAKESMETTMMKTFVYNLENILKWIW